MKKLIFFEAHFLKNTLNPAWSDFWPFFEKGAKNHSQTIRPSHRNFFARCFLATLILRKLKNFIFPILAIHRCFCKKTSKNYTFYVFSKTTHAIKWRLIKVFLSNLVVFHFLKSCSKLKNHAGFSYKPVILFWNLSWGSKNDQITGFWPKVKSFYNYFYTNYQIKHWDLKKSRIYFQKNKRLSGEKTRNCTFCVWTHFFRKKRDFF